MHGWKEQRRSLRLEVAWWGIWRGLWRRVCCAEVAVCAGAYDAAGGAVDASVGGKVGVDHGAGKNLIGAFHQPRVVVTDIAAFKTLPVREVRCGLAECIKHGVIRDASLFAFIAGNVGKLLECEMGVMTELVARNVAIKAADCGAGSV